jgi:hypothetical protein
VIRRVAAGLIALPFAVLFAAIAGVRIVYEVVKVAVREA